MCKEIMGTINQMLKGVQSINLPEQVPVIIEQTKETAIELNKMQLYKSSINKEGMKLELYSSPLYAIQKEKQNPIPGFLHPDLYLTGSFYAGWQMIVKKFSFDFTSTDSKTFELIKDYGDDIFGLTAKSKSEYGTKAVWPAIKSWITAKSGLRFN